MIPAVFDCMTFLQAVGSPRGPASACLTLVDEMHVKLFVSSDILEEVRDVIHRPNIRKAFPKLTDEVAQDFLDHIVDTAHAVDPVPKIYTLARDPDDERYLNLAIAAQAAFIVSRDNDLLDLMKDDTFRNAYPALAIIDPPSFLRHVRGEIAQRPGHE